MTTQPDDLIDRLMSGTGSAADDPLRALRAQRTKVRVGIELSRGALFDSSLALPSLRQRWLLATDLCRRAGAVGLSEVYRDGATAAGVDHALLDPSAASAPHADGVLSTDPITAVMLRFARTLSDRPRDGDHALLDSLGAAGIDTPGTIALAQLIGFLSFEIRVVAGLRGLKAATGGPAAADKGDLSGISVISGISGISDLSGINQVSGVRGAAALGEVIESNGFTNAPLEWRSWLPLVDVEQASANQLVVLEASHPNAKVSEYYRALVHQPAILRQRSETYNAIMYAPGGLPRADRELAAMVVSRVNGCVYCGSVHAQRFEQLARRNDVVVATFDDPDHVLTTPRDAVIARFSAQLTRTPAGDLTGAVAKLLAFGLQPLEVLDLIHVVAVFAWANRLMLNLGEPVANSGNDRGR